MLRNLANFISSYFVPPSGFSIFEICIRMHTGAVQVHIWQNALQPTTLKKEGKGLVTLAEFLKGNNIY